MLYGKFFRYAKATTINITLATRDLTQTSTLLKKLLDSDWATDFRVRLAIVSPDFISTPTTSTETLEWVRNMCKIWVPHDVDRGGLILQDGMLPAVSGGFYGPVQDLSIEIMDDVFAYFEVTIEASVSGSEKT